MEIEIIGMNHNGDGIGKVNGKVIFVPKSAVGDRVIVKYIIEYKNYCVGYIDSFIKYSDDRVDIRCPFYNNCGGCQIMEISYDNQLEYKRKKVIDIFNKYSSISINPLIVGCSEFGYRNKVIFQVKDGKIGFFCINSNDFVEISKCLLISDRMNNVLSIINDNLNLDKVNKIMIRDSNDGCMVVFYGYIDNIDIDIFNGFVCSIYVNDKYLCGKELVNINLGNFSFVISPQSFFQVNLEQTLNLYNYVRDNIFDNSKLLDLYCGTGSIGIFCTDKCMDVVGIEINSSAIMNANSNKAINGVDNINFKCINANRINYKEGDFDVVVVDPPRGGLDKKTINILNNIKSNRVIYVSCNPITLARDYNILRACYDIKDIKLFDMFPNTYHVETVMILERKQ